MVWQALHLIADKNRARKVRTNKLPSQAYGWVLFVLLLASLPALIHLPIWVAGIVLAAIAWRFLGEKLGNDIHKGIVGKVVVGVLLLAGLAGIYLSFPSLFGGDSIMTFFVIVVVLKWAESQTRRDGLLMIFAAVILSAVGGMYWQNILSLFHMLLVALALVIALLAINDEEGVFSWTQLLSKAGGMFLLALPLMAIMFVSLPRIPGPIWDIGLAFGMPINLSLKNDKKGPSIGTKANGKGISRANQSRDAVLVAEFPNGDMPYKSQLYWRGPVFYDFDGVDWLLNDKKDTAKAVKATAVTKKSYDRMIVSKKNPVTYKVRVSAHNSHWLYALDMPYGAFPETKITENIQLVSVRPVSNGEFKYEMTGYLGYEIGKDLKPEKKQRALVLPESSNPRLQALGKKLAQDNQSSEEIMQEALKLYSKTGFIYNLFPELKDEKDNLDTFFFDVKNGNAMHLAGSFIALMRSAGVPSRLVTGFRGGDLIALTDFIIVRDTHAFAWPEVWLDGKGWVRVDVKDIVVPASIEQKSKGEKKKQSQDNKPKIKAENIKNPEQTKKTKEVINVVEKKANKKTKAENNGLFGWKKWSKGLEKWVLNYNPNRQVELFKGAGIKKVNWAGMAGWAIGALLLFMLAYVGVMRWRYRQMADPLADAWKSFVAKIEKLGIASTAQECPSKLQSRIAKENPDLAVGTNEVINAYLDLRYGNIKESNDADVFIRQVKRFVAMT